MSKYFVLKFIAISVVCVFLLVALGTVGGLVNGRKAYRDQALQSIADGAAGSQQLEGPIWVLPYRRQIVGAPDEKTGKRETSWQEAELKVLPEKLAITGQMHSFVRKRDIYQALLYGSNLHISGSFNLPANANRPTNELIEWGTPHLSVGISDMRGIRQSPTAVWGDKTVAFQPGTALLNIEHGIHAPLPAYDGHATVVSFSFNLMLDGMDRFSVIPLGRDTEMSITSDWPSPSFIGRIAPVDRAVRANGFDARWRTSWFATNLNEQFERCNSTICEEMEATALTVRLIDPVDVYAQTDRAVKYGFLFIVLTIASFFLTEVLRRIAIHPFQYGLVGVSLAIFFLLLLSLAEQMPFWLAYVLAAGACVFQNAFYARFALGGLRPGLMYAGFLTTLYGMLYLLLCMESYALLCGSVLLFCLLTGVMVLTRRLNWYSVGGQTAAGASDA